MRQLITILTTFFPVAFATPVFPIIKPFIPHSLSHAIPISIQSDLPTETVITGPIPTKWRHTHGPMLHGPPSDVGPVCKSDEPAYAIGAKRRLPRAINCHSNGIAAAADTEEILRNAPERRILIPPPPMTDVEICEALCSMYDAEPCGPCEAVFNSPSATRPLPNAERTDTVSARAATTPQEDPWFPLWRCLTQCLEERRIQCDECNGFWAIYQSTLSPAVYEEPEAKHYLEMVRCLLECGRGKSAPICIYCQTSWYNWERELWSYLGSRGPMPVVTMGNRVPVREDFIGITLYRCLKECNPDAPETSQELCRRCKMMVTIIPPAFVHNWILQRLMAKPEDYNPLTTGPSGPYDHDDD